jgi:hypothetical protein
MKPLLLLLAALGMLGPVAPAQWSTPTAMTGINSTAGDYDPCPTLDGLTLYFASTRAGTYDLFRATRAAPYAQFGNPVLITELSTGSIEGGPCVRFDDCEVFFYTNRPGGGGGYDLWRADRPSPAVPFNPPAPVTELNTTAAEHSPSLTFDGLQIWFYSTRPGGAGGYDIWTATRPNWGSPFGTPTPVTELNTPNADRDPHIAPDGLSIAFSSDRAGGLGGDDLWVATRLTTSAPFGAIVPVPALNHAAVDHASAFSLFQDEVFFTSTRPGGLGSYDLYSARFTGLLGLGIAGPGSSQDLRFSDPASAGRFYFAASSGGSVPGIPIDTRVLPLNFDLLLQLTLGGLPPLLNGYVGVLDADGIAAGRITFIGFPQLVGLRFVTAFLVLDPAAPSGIRTISNAHETLVQ